MHPRSTTNEPDQLWGAETANAVRLGPVSGRTMPTSIIRWLARVKEEAAAAHAELGLLDPDVADRIRRAAHDVAEGRYADQFPVDVFQTGSGTSTNMNVNEVIARLAGEDVHPNDHVNLGQSSNDVVPTAVHLAALEAATRHLLPALELLEAGLAERAGAWSSVVKAGRTHLMDALPVTLGDEFGGYAAQMQLAGERISATLPRVAAVPLGGTAVGTGLNAHPEFAARVRAGLATRHGIEPVAPRNRFEAQAARDALVELSGALEVLAVSLTKFANDIVLMASGPRAGLAELEIPETQHGSSIMPGKVNPVVPEIVLQIAAQVIGNHTTIAVAGSQGNFELNVRVPVIATNLLDSLHLLTRAAELLVEFVAALTANEVGCRERAERSLSSAAVLNPQLGYDTTTQLVRDAIEHGDTLVDAGRRLGVDAELVADAIDPQRLARGNREPQER